ncbi:UDP-N-acetyl-D-mannosamine dehydrogenase [Arthrobacter sp. Bz4]|uniref:UDP-N-acetyl-D-mannosamine dehydrogenase n=1 Tax=Arthrobacter sp. Bz4 TaxID=2171979 RepID=UPI000D521FAA|nr:UDP-N-acetyl-D-mannosamine dehydrogenase [Arthrobacter sp. Bz4]PVE15872.1 UDP-N-acetyl-D-mannosamine dehydrogenase [Arthrobacter sp. Bz4]
MNIIQNVAVIGLGYIGLPTAAILATNGINVVGVDVSTRTVEAVNRGEVPFVEPDLSVHVAGAVAQGRLKATKETPKAEAYIVAVPTPFNADKSADLSYIEAAARGIAPQLSGGELIILESTSPPGATQHLGDYLVRLRPDLSLEQGLGRPQILIAHCPERVLPGRVMIELVTNDRIIGGITRDAALSAKALYETFCQGEIHLTDATTAEMAKLVENSFRDVNIAFANELSIISDKLNIDVWELIELANYHPRVNILQPGPGVGGHCIAVDPWFIVAAAPEEATLIRQARLTNDAKPDWVVERVVTEVKDLPPGASVAALGLSFKANIDDLRESPAIDIVISLASRLPNTRILVSEPHINGLPSVLGDLSNVYLVDSTESAIADAEVILLLVNHDSFADVDPKVLESKRIIDTRGIWRNSQAVESLEL